MTEQQKKTPDPFAQLVRRVRRTQGLSQAQFAKKYGLNVRTVQYWETNTRKKPDGAGLSIMLMIEKYPAQMEFMMKTVDRTPFETP